MKNILTVTQVAEELGLTTGRIRQICREYNIGEVVGRDRLMTVDDLQRIKKIPDRRKKKAS